MPDLAISCVLATSGTGAVSLEVENFAGGYELEVSSMSEAKVTWRRHEVTNQWVEGTFTIGAVKENVVETLAVWVSANDNATLLTRIQALTKILDSLAYTITWTEGGVSRTWNCQVADYTVRSDQPLRFTTQVLVTAQIPRTPSLGAVTGTELENIASFTFAPFSTVSGVPASA